MTTEQANRDVESLQVILTDMQQDSTAYLRGLADGAMQAVAQVELAAETAERQGHDIPAAALRELAMIIKTRLNVEIEPRSIKLQVGNFSAVGDGPRCPRVRIDDRIVTVTGFQVECSAREVTRINLQIVPIISGTGKRE